MNRQGIDVYEGNGSIDWHKAGGTIAYAFCKVSQGLTHNDALWTRERVGELRAAGIAFGGYHYADNSGDDGAAEARHFVKQLKAAGWKAEEAGKFFDRLHKHGWSAVAGHCMPGALDIESGTGGHPGTIFVRRFVHEYAKLTGHLPIIYTGSFWRDALANPVIATRCRLWLAAYVSNPLPFLPRAWKRPTFWQYTDGFHCPGAAAPVDGDKFMGHGPKRKRSHK